MSKMIAKYVLAACLGVTTVLAAGCGGGAADDGKTPAGTEPVAETEQKLTKTIQCGSVGEFNTWSFWGVTTVNVWNRNPEIGTIWIEWQSGTGNPVQMHIASTAQWSGRWAGFPLYVRYLGYTTPSGQEIGCMENSGIDPNSPPRPELLVTTR